MDAPFLVFSAKGKPPLQPSSVTNTESTPSHQTLSLENPLPSLLHSLLNHSVLTGGRRSKMVQANLGSSKKECNTDPSFPALYPHSRRSAESRGVLRRVRPPAWFTKTITAMAQPLASHPKSLWEPSTGFTQYSPRTRLPHNRAMQLLSK